MLRVALRYFLLVFAAGFALGTLRTLWIVPRLGERRAELLEFPLMFAVLFFASRYVVDRFMLSPRGFLGAGCLAAAFLFVFDTFLVGALRGLSPAQAILGRDPLTGAIYYAMQVLFALFPYLRARR